MDLHLLRSIIIFCFVNNIFLQRNKFIEKKQIVFNKIEDIVRQQETSIDGSLAEVCFFLPENKNNTTAKKSVCESLPMNTEQRGDENFF